MAANQKGTELFAHQDLKGLVAHYTADATLMFPGMDVIQGRDGEGVCLCVCDVCVCQCSSLQSRHSVPFFIIIVLLMCSRTLCPLD